MIDRAAIGAALRSARKSIGMTAAIAAEQIGCSERHIRRIETIEAPTDIKRLEPYCALYKVHPVTVIAAGYRKNIEVIHTTDLTDECKSILRLVVDAFTSSSK